MQLTLLKSKIHRARITAVNLDYEGSISIDPVLLKSAGILPYEQVHVVNANNGARLITYAISGEEGSGEIALNGAAARCALPGDIIIIIAYCTIDENRCENHNPVVVHVDANNRIVD